MYNLKKRHVEGRPYTRTGDVIVAVNPYCWYNILYTPEEQQYYADKLLWDDFGGSSFGSFDGSLDGSVTSNSSDDDKSLSDPSSMKKEDRPQIIPPNLSPHIYEMATIAYKRMALWGKPQSVLLSGESGAGKTESAKLCMHHIAALQLGPQAAGAGHEQTLVVTKILDTNPLLEAFGNAKTQRNDNSSRFGRYTRLEFDRTHLAVKSRHRRSLLRTQTSPARLVGSTCEVYLLEKNRVVNHDPNEERTYHIFYQLLAAPSAERSRIWKAGLKHAKPESFRYVGSTRTNRIEGKSDRARFVETVEALEEVGIVGLELDELFQSLCIVLQLGNLTFAPDPNDDDKSIITSENELKKLGSLMGISQDALQLALTERTMVTKDETYKVPLTAASAKESCDGLSKDIYEKVFLWLVDTTNRATCAERNYEGHQEHSNYALIGLLDIFGFEAFYLNRFEQLCINYANEKLQYKFTEDCFKLVELEYKYEGIPVQQISYRDNIDVLDLIEGKSGLVALLNEECWRPQGSSLAFVNKALHQNKASKCLIVNTMDRLSFGVAHYAGQVLYDAEDFVTRNQDKLPTDLKECASKSSNHIISNAFTTVATEESAPKKGGRSKNSNIMSTTVWTKYKKQLTQLMADLYATESHYIRCIKPNNSKQPLVMEHNLTIAQLRACGIVGSVMIARSAFPNRMLNQNVLARFRGIFRKKGAKLSPKKKRRRSTEKESWKKETEELLTRALDSIEALDPDTGKVIPAFVVGKTKTFFRPGSLEYLEAERINSMDIMAARIQRCYRTLLRKREALKAADNLQWRRAEHRKLAKERRLREAAEQRDKEARRKEEKVAFEKKLAAQKQAFEEQMTLEAALLAEQMEREDRELEEELEADQKAWEEKMETDEREWEDSMDAQERERSNTEAEYVRLTAEMAALKEELCRLDQEAAQKARAVEDEIIHIRDEERHIEAKTDNVWDEHRGHKREQIFAEAISTERDKFIVQLERDRKRLEEVFDRVEEKYEDLLEENKRLKKECNEVGAKFEKRRSLTMSMTQMTNDVEVAFEKAKYENEDLHMAGTKHMEMHSLMTQCRLEAQNGLRSMMETVQAESNDPKLKTAVMRLNRDVSKQAYIVMKEIAEKQSQEKMAS